MNALTDGQSADVTFKAPADCADAEIESFCALVRAGGEVQAKGLPGRVRAARLLTFLRLQGELRGVAGLKHPSENHRAEVEEGSGVSLPSAEYPYEIGWVYVEPQARGGKSLALCEPLVDAHRNEGIFATSRSDNVAMHRTLQRLGFQRVGRDWPSGQNPAKLWLFARAPASAARAP